MNENVQVKQKGKFVIFTGINTRFYWANTSYWSFFSKHLCLIDTLFDIKEEKLRIQLLFLR